jgi:hypothetical protein
VAFSASRFFVDQYELFRERKNAEVRILVEDPGSEAFSQMCLFEARDPQRMAREIMEITDAVTSHAVRRRLNPDLAEISLRWRPGITTVTLTRVNDVIYCRSRVFDEGRDAETFFEKYVASNPKSFKAVSEHFDNLWRASGEPRLVQAAS